VGYFVSKAISETSGLPLEEETKILKDFNNLLNTHFNQPQHVLCGHNAKNLIFLFARRMIINQIAIPNKLNLFEPWREIHFGLWSSGISILLL
jgi:hypothetical protein